MNGPVDARAIDANTPRAFCRWLLAHRRLYALPAAAASADWVRALKHFAGANPDADAFEAELKDWQRWPPLSDLLFSEDPDTAFDVGHLLSLAWSVRTLNVSTAGAGRSSRQSASGLAASCAGIARKASIQLPRRGALHAGG